MKVVSLTLPLLLSVYFASQALAGELLHHEVTPEIVFYNGDAMRTATIGGLEYTYKLSPTWWIGVDGLFGDLNIDRGNSVGLKSGDKLIGVNGAIYINLPSLVGVTTKPEEGLSADLYTSIGAGNLWLGDKTEFYGFLGGGMVLQTGLRWLSVRFDLKGLFFKLENGAGNDFNSDLLLSIGPSIVF